MKQGEGEKEQQYVKDWISQAKDIMRGWISRYYKQGLLNRAMLSLYRVETTAETQVSSFIL